MTAKDFKEQWKHIEGKPVNIGYGKQIFRNIVLTEYKEALATVKTSMQGLLNVRSIKTITPLEISKPEAVIEVPVEEVVVSPQLPEGWNEKGYFVIVGKFAGNWKRAELRDKEGNVYFLGPLRCKSGSSFDSRVLIEWVVKFRQYLFNSLLLNPTFLIDDTFAIPQYYRVNNYGIEKVN